MTTPLIYHQLEIEEIIQSEGFHESLLDALSRGFLQFQQTSEFCAAPVQTLGAPPLAPFAHNVPDYAAQVCIKTGYFARSDYFVVKVAAGGSPLPRNTGLMQVFAQATGQLECLLMDEGILTEVRTAALGSLVARFATIPLSRIGIVGTGVQARHQLDFLKHVTDCRRVLIWGRNREHAQTLKDDLERQGGWAVDIANDADTLLDECELVVTVTSAREPVLTRSGTKVRFIVCIGADAPGKKELDPSVVHSASLLVADSLDQTFERGEFQGVEPSRVISLGEWIKSPELHHQEGTIVVDSSGVSLQDCIIAEMVYKILQNRK